MESSERVGSDYSGPFVVEQLSKTSNVIFICATVTSKRFTYFGQVYSSWLFYAE